MKILAYAKINLRLEVLGKRADGFHDLRSLVLPLTLADELAIDLSPTFSCESPFPNDLCLKAARELHSAARLPPTTCASISVSKKIPVGGGLGGGSADAAATLVALNDLWQCNLNLSQLVEIASRVGSDVPALVLARFHGAILMEGRGERVSPFQQQSKKPLYIVLANPGVFSSTPKVFSTFKRNNLVPENTEIFSLANALEKNDLDEISKYLRNDLEDAALKLYPEIAKTKQILADAHARAIMMSGSGATVFALASSETEAEKIATRVKEKGVMAWTVSSLVP